MKKTFREFNKTLYGKTIFFLAYIIPFVIFLVGIVTLIAGIVQSCVIILSNAANLFCVFGITFVLANIYFYSEIRKFCEHNSK